MGQINTTKKIKKTIWVNLKSHSIIISKLPFNKYRFYCKDDQTIGKRDKQSNMDIYIFYNL